jgi:hypothetical protein
MVPDMSESKILMMYTEGLTEPLRGWVKAFKTETLQDVIECTRDLVGAVSKNKVMHLDPQLFRGERKQDN